MSSKRPDIIDEYLEKFPGLKQTGILNLLYDSLLREAVLEYASAEKAEELKPIRHAQSLNYLKALKKFLHHYASVPFYQTEDQSWQIYSKLDKAAKKHRHLGCQNGALSDTWFFHTRIYPPEMLKEGIKPKDLDMDMLNLRALPWLSGDHINNFTGDYDDLPYGQPL